MYMLIDNFFSRNECNAALCEVNENQSLWYHCDETDMYILGNSFMRRHCNINLARCNFRTTHIFKEKLLEIFSKINFFKNIGKPGFQIIKKNATKNSSVWHYDSTLRTFPYDLEFADYNNKFNQYFEEYYVFTLMLSDGNFSFDYFPETKSKFGNTDIEEDQIFVCDGHVGLVGDDCPNRKCHLKQYKTINYKQGSLLIQDERFLHRVGYTDINDSNCHRVTLNGYGVVKNGIMYLFW